MELAKEERDNIDLDAQSACHRCQIFQWAAAMDYLAKQIESGIHNK